MGGSKKSHVITDVFGRNVRITKERLNHILMVHPEMKKLEDKIAHVLKDPDYIKQSTYDEEIILYYKYFTSIKKYITVVVKRDMYFVLTSSIINRIKEGDTMEKKMKFFYDKEGDVLDISLGKPEEATSEEIGDDTIIRVNEKNEIVGVTILNFEKRFEKSEIEYLPLYAKFSLIQN